MSLTFDLKIGRFPVMHYEVVRLVDDVPPHPEGIFKYRATATPPGERARSVDIWHAYTDGAAVLARKALKAIESAHPDIYSGHTPKPSQQATGPQRGSIQGMGVTA